LSSLLANLDLAVSLESITNMDQSVAWIIEVEQQQQQQPGKISIQICD
jgi:hypothetical protein